MIINLQKGVSVHKNCSNEHIKRPSKTEILESLTDALDEMAHETVARASQTGYHPTIEKDVTMEYNKIS